MGRYRSSIGSTASNRKPKEKCFVRLERLEEMGHELRRPEAENLGDDIYELRAKHLGVNYRMIYFFHGKAAVVVTFFNTWVLFEETVVDRYGLWEYMPYYRVAKLCSWDIGALALIIWSTFWMFRRHRRSLESGG